MPEIDLSAANTLSPHELARYARQIGPGVLTIEGQARLKAARVLVTRAGGVGGPAAQALVMAGVGRVVLAHGGALHTADLNRQVLGAEDLVGQGRAVPFARRLQKLNRFVTVEAIDHEPDQQEALRLAREVDLILSCAPTFAERLCLNRAAVAAGVPLIDAAQWGLTATLMVLVPGHTACLRCVYPEDPPFEESFPVLGAISAAVGSLAALEAIKLLSGCGEVLAGRLWLIDAYQGRNTQVQLQARADCPECGAAPPARATGPAASPCP